MQIWMLRQRRCKDVVDPLGDPLATRRIGGMPGDVVDDDTYADRRGLAADVEILRSGLVEIVTT